MDYSITEFLRRILIGLLALFAVNRLYAEPLPNLPMVCPDPSTIAANTGMGECPSRTYRRPASADALVWTMQAPRWQAWKDITSEPVFVCTLPLEAQPVTRQAEDSCRLDSVPKASYLAKSAAVGPTAPKPQPPADIVFTGETLLSWTPPTQNTDGTSLTNLAGYNIYYGTTNPPLGPPGFELKDPGLVSHLIQHLTAATWYFQVTAVNTFGRESDRSNTASKTITACTAPQPPDETQQVACAAPLVRDWLQTRSYRAVAAPLCWEAGPWTPAEPPVGACTPPPVPWTVMATASGTRPVYELVRNATDTGWARGCQVGDIDVGKPCDAVRFLGSARYPYHAVSQTDVRLASPTYRGRTLIAICAQ